MSGPTGNCLQVTRLKDGLQLCNTRKPESVLVIDRATYEQLVRVLAGMIPKLTVNPDGSFRCGALTVKFSMTADGETTLSTEEGTVTLTDQEIEYIGDAYVGKKTDYDSLPVDKRVVFGSEVLFQE